MCKYCKKVEHVIKIDKAECLLIYLTLLNKINLKSSSTSLNKESAENWKIIINYCLLTEFRLLTEHKLEQEFSLIIRKQSLGIDKFWTWNIHTSLDEKN